MLFTNHIFNKLPSCTLYQINHLYINEIPSNKFNNSLLYLKKYFTHYRFHKRVGKGNWNRYIERYTKPASIENTQPIHFNYKASYQSKKNSLSYLWELPKKIASATTSNSLLDSWVYYRHKRKKLYHYVLALKRLCEIKDVDISDWRFKLIEKKVVKRSRYFTDLPAVCLYLGKLKCVDSIEKVTYHLIERMDYYSPFQLGRIASSFSSCRLFNQFLFSILAKRFIGLIDIAENHSILSVAKALSNCLVYNFKLLNSISLEFQRRLNKDTDPNNDRSVNKGHLCFSFKLNHNPPTIDELLELGESFAMAKFKDLNYFNTLSQLLVYHLNNTNDLNPSIVSRAMSVYSRLKINDMDLIENVLNEIHSAPYNYPPFIIASIMKDISSMIPKSLTVYINKIEDLLNHTTSYLDIFDNNSLTDIAICMNNTSLSNAVLMNRIHANVIKNFKDSSSDYDSPKLFEILSKKSVLNNESFRLFCHQSKKLLYQFEPCDFMRVARLLRRHKDYDTDVNFVNLMGLRLSELSEEFTPKRYNSVATDLFLSGKLQDGISKEIWSKNTLEISLISLHRYPKGFKPSNV